MRIETPRNVTDHSPAHLNLAQQCLHHPLRILASILHHTSNLLKSTKNVSFTPSNNTSRETHSAIPASPMHSYNQLSLVVTTAPACLNLANAIGISCGLQLLTPSAMIYTLCPAASASIVVCVTQMWLSMPTMTISEGVLEEKWWPRAGHMLKAVLSTSATAVDRLSSGQVGPRRAAFWVVA